MIYDSYNKDFIAQGSIALLACPMQVKLDVGRVNSRRTFFEWAGKVTPAPPDEPRYLSSFNNKVKCLGQVNLPFGQVRFGNLK